MSVTVLDVAIVVAFYTVVVGFSLFKSRGRRTSADYFLGGRQIPWWLIGISIVAANLSTEQVPWTISTALKKAAVSPFRMRRRDESRTSGC